MATIMCFRPVLRLATMISNEPMSWNLEQISKPLAKTCNSKSVPGSGFRFFGASETALRQVYMNCADEEEKFTSLCNEQLPCLGDAFQRTCASCMGASTCRNPSSL